MHSTIAQVNSYVPDAYSYFSQNLALYNPSYITEEGSYDFTLQHKFLTGQFKDISNTNFIASKNMRQEKNSAALRLLIGREQEGPYITIPRFGLSYGYALKLKEQLSLCAGLNLGATGLYLSAPSVSASYFLPDGVVGVGVRYKTLYVGVSSMQIFNAVRTSFALRRYFNGIATHALQLGPNWQVKNQLFSNLVPDANTELKYALLASFKESIDIGLGLSTKSGYSYLASFVLPLKNDKLRLSLAYNTNFIRKNYFIANSMEIMVGLILD